MGLLLHNVTSSQNVDFKILESFGTCCNELVLFVDSPGEMGEEAAVPGDG
jgi:hypothetical protein